MRNELRSVILALAARTASFRVNFVFGLAARGQSVSFALGVAGSSGASIVELWATGCMLMGPAFRGLLPCIGDNAFPPNLFAVMDRTYNYLSVTGFDIRERFRGLA